MEEKGNYHNPKHCIFHADGADPVTTTVKRNVRPLDVPMKTATSNLRTDKTGDPDCSEFLQLKPIAIVGSAIQIFALPTGGDTATHGAYEVRTHVSGDGRSSRYLRYLPKIAKPPAGYPVIMFLNGFGENDNDGLRQVESESDCGEGCERNFCCVCGKGIILPFPEWVEICT